VLAIALYFDENSLKNLKKDSDQILSSCVTSKNNSYLIAPSLHLTLFAGIEDKYAEEIKKIFNSTQFSKINVENNGIGIFINKKIVFHFRWKHSFNLVEYRKMVYKFFNDFIEYNALNGYGRDDWIAKTTLFTTSKVDTEFCKSLKNSFKLNQLNIFECNKLIVIKYKDSKEDIIYTKQLTNENEKSKI